MATRFYFSDAQASPINPNFGGWGESSEAVRRKLLTAKQASGEALNLGTKIGWTAGQTQLDRQYVSPPMASGISFSSATVKIQLAMREFANADNVDAGVILLKIVNRAGDTVQQTLKALGLWGSNTEAINNASLRNKNFANTSLVDGTYTTVDGDRLVIELGFRDNTGTSPEAQARYGAPSATADHGENETETTSLVPWLEMSNTITFVAEKYTKSVTIDAILKLPNQIESAQIANGSRVQVRKSSGEIYTAYRDSGTSEIHIAKQDANNLWIDQDTANEPTGADTDAIAIAIDAIDVIHGIFWDEGTGLRYFTFNTSSNTFSSVVTAHTQLATLTGGIRHVAITIDANNIPHIVFTDAEDGTFSYVVCWYRNRIGGTWNTAVSTNVDATSHHFPDITICDAEGSGDRPIVVSLRNTGTNGQYNQFLGNALNATSFSQGSANSSPVASFTDPKYAPSIAVTSTNKIYVGMRRWDLGGVLIANHPQGTFSSGWTYEHIESGGTTYNGISVFAVGNYIYIFAENDSNDDIIYFTNRTGSWVNNGTIETGTYNDVKAKWSKYNNNFGKLKSVAGKIYDGQAGTILGNRGTSNTVDSGILLSAIKQRGSVSKLVLKMWRDSGVSAGTFVGKVKKNVVCGGSVGTELVTSNETITITSISTDSGAPTTVTLTFPTSLVNFETMGIAVVIDLTGLTGGTLWYITKSPTDDRGGVVELSGTTGCIPSEEIDGYIEIYPEDEIISYAFEDGSNVKTNSLDIPEIKTKTISVDAVLKKKQTKSVTIDAVLKLPNLVESAQIANGSRELVRNSSGVSYMAYRNSGDSTIRIAKQDSSNLWFDQDNSNNMAGIDTDAVACAIDSTDKIHVIGWDEGTGLRYKVFDTATNTWTGTIATAYAQNDTITTARKVSISIDVNDIPHVTFIDAEDTMFAFNSIWYGNRIGGVWNTKVRVVVSETDFVSCHITMALLRSTINEVRPVITTFALPDGFFTVYGNALNATSFTSFASAFGETSFIGSLVENSTKIIHPQIRTNGDLRIVSIDNDTFGAGYVDVSTARNYIDASSFAVGEYFYVFATDEFNDVRAFTNRSGSWVDLGVIDAGTYNDVKAKWSKYYNGHYSYFQETHSSTFGMSNDFYYGQRITWNNFIKNIIVKVDKATATTGTFTLQILRAPNGGSTSTVLASATETYNISSLSAGVQKVKFSIPNMMYFNEEIVIAIKATGMGGGTNMSLCLSSDLQSGNVTAFEGSTWTNFLSTDASLIIDSIPGYIDYAFEDGSNVKTNSLDIPDIKGKNITFDAILVRKKTKAVTLDAILKQVRTKAISLDAILRKTQIKNITLDAIISQATKFKFISLDAILINRRTKNITLDAVLRKTFTKAITINARLIFRRTKAISLDAILRQTRTKNISLDALLRKTFTKNISLDAILKQVRSKSISIDGILQATRTKLISLDAILQQTRSKNITIDAVLKQVRTKAISINARLINRRTKSITLDAILRQTRTKAISINARLIVRRTKAITLDALLKQVRIKTVTLDAILQKTLTKNISLDAILRQTRTKAISLDALLQKKFSKNISLDAILKAKFTKSVSIDAVLQATRTKLITLNAILVNRRTKSITIDALLRNTFTKAISINARLINRRTKTVTLDAVLRQIRTKTISLDALLQKTFTKTISLDALLQKKFTKNISLDAILRQTRTKAISINARLINRRTKAISLDALLQQVRTKSISLDALLKQVRSKSISLDAVLKQTRSKAVSIDAMLQKKFTKNISIDALLQQARTKAISINARLINRRTKTISLDALLKQVRSKSVTLDALLKQVRTKAISLDARLISPTKFKYITLDALLRQTRSKNISLDAILRQTRTKVISLDAMLQKKFTKPVSLDALLQQTRTKLASIDAVLRQTRSKNITLDAVLKQARTKAVSINARLINRRIKSITLDALLQKKFSKNVSLDALLKQVRTKFISLDAMLKQARTKIVSMDVILLKKQSKPLSIDAVLQAKFQKQVSIDAILDFFEPLSDITIVDLVSLSTDEIEITSQSNDVAYLPDSNAINDIEIIGEFDATITLISQSTDVMDVEEV